ncbi:hypothetical protein DSLASN_42320 [Desulfoluna limicola]|uniref:Uncharacterized protein n=1 Tax=Desulfoluna limicola TaxID=2810562 RepID=A0ABM7PN32_9BACT|nr:hypothetical protein DSLASN_42320 [Desulfoluna limicola]
MRPVRCRATGRANAFALYARVCSVHGKRLSYGCFGSIPSVDYNRDIFGDKGGKNTPKPGGECDPFVAVQRAARTHSRCV